jgi:hypothetical protein
VVGGGGGGGRARCQYDILCNELFNADQLIGKLIVL